MDREAEFGRLYEAHRAAVHAYFAGKTGDRQLAADLMQEVFLRAWQHLDKVAGLPEDGQRGWLFTVARNLSVDAARHQRTADGAQRALEREPSTRQDLAVAPASTAVLAAERAGVVAAAIATLPEQQRVTLDDGRRRRDEQRRDRRGAGRAGRHRPLPAFAGPPHPGRGARRLR